jgi:pyruvate,orthophosphate dikinase
MVFGNTGTNSGSGVAFTRDPATGEKTFYGEFLINAQGEDVVAGVRTPEPVGRSEEASAQGARRARAHPPGARVALQGCAGFRVHHPGRQGLHAPDPQWQAHRRRRRAFRVWRWSKEKLIDWKTAINRVPADQLDQVLAPVFDRAALKAAKAIAHGLPAGPGAATGRVYFNADRAAAAAAKGERVLLVRIETSPEDLRGMIAAEGILTARGGVSSHAALVARQMGKVCVCGAAGSRSITRPRR